MTTQCQCTCCTQSQECSCFLRIMQEGQPWCTCTYCEGVRQHIASHKEQYTGHKALLECWQHGRPQACYVTTAGVHIPQSAFTMRAIYICANCQRPHPTRDAARRHILEEHPPLTKIIETHW